jgi:hypothetical protein
VPTALHWRHASGTLQLKIAEIVQEVKNSITRNGPRFGARAGRAVLGSRQNVSRDFFNVPLSAIAEAEAAGAYADPKAAVTITVSTSAVMTVVSAVTVAVSIMRSAVIRSTVIPRLAVTVAV